jgi:hypothetical protein
MRAQAFLADSHSADFQEGTWTFEPHNDFTVVAGTFAIIPQNQYESLLSAVRGIRNSMAVHPDCTMDSEFMDMVTRVDEVLIEIGED